MWSEEEYWSKAKLYVRRAQSAEADEGLYPFWLSLALEFIARAALSKVNPVLNADPQQIENVYFALGLGNVGSPKTVPLHSVFVRCVTIVDGFEDSHRKFCDFLGVQRNEELHTGALPFEDLKLQKWLPDYYEVLDILCRHLERDLAELLGCGEAEAARDLLKATAKGLKATVKRSIAAHKRVFEVKPEEERQELESDAWVRAMAAKASTQFADLVNCPSCSSSGLLRGRPLRKTKPEYEDGLLVEEVTCRSESFSCQACGLKLASVSHLHWSGIEPQFNVTLETSLHDHQEFEYYEEYMNE